VRRDRQDEHEPATLLGPPDTDGVLLNLAGNLAQPSRTLRLAADALLQAWPEAELPAGPRPACGPARRPCGRAPETGYGPAASIRCYCGPGTAWITPA
jgi:hypothetical protein